MAYSNDVYREAFKIIEDRRTKAEEELRIRRTALYQKCPRVQTIENELAQISIRAGRAVLEGADVRSQLEKLKASSLSLQRELNELLEERGLPLNYLDEWFTCPDCEDTGNIDGKMCNCMKTLIRKIAYERLNSISPLSLSTFDSFVLDYYPAQKTDDFERAPREYMEQVFRYCQKYANEFSVNSPSLLFQGSPGLGKTHLSLAIAQKAIEKGYGVIYVSTPKILSQLERERFGSRYGESGESEELLIECDLLILDDLGTEFQTKYSVSTIYDIINTRLLMSKPTIISTNLTLKEMQDTYGSRVISRVIGMLNRVEFVGNDIRQMKRRERRK